MVESGQQALREKTRRRLYVWQVARKGKHITTNHCQTSFLLTNISTFHLSDELHRSCLSCLYSPRWLEANVDPDWHQSRMISDMIVALPWIRSVSNLGGAYMKLALFSIKILWNLIKYQGRVTSEQRYLNSATFPLKECIDMSLYRHLCIGMYINFYLYSYRPICINVYVCIDIVSYVSKCMYMIICLYRYTPLCCI